jgi:hypothetical protein
MKTPELNKNTIILLAVIGAGIFLFFAGKGILTALGFAKTDSQKEAERIAKEAGKVTPENLTISQNQAVNLADSIHEALKYSSLDDDKPEAVRLLKTLKNDDDFKLLQNAFGERKEYFFGVPTGGAKTLSQFMTGNFNNRQKAELKKDFSGKNIKTVF